GQSGDDLGAISGWENTHVKATGDPGDDGQPGDDGATPQIAIGSDNYWYICPSGTCTGQSGDDLGAISGWEKTPVQATGNKGDKGDTGAAGAPGATPEVAIGNDGYWYVCPSGTCTGASGDDLSAIAGWTNTNTPATGQQGAQGAQGDAIFAENGVDYTSHDDYDIFTLANSTTLQVPKYRPLSIDFAPPGTFTHSQTRDIGFTVASNARSITAVDVPRGWTVTPALEAGANPTAGTITVTAPANDGKRYTATGTATLLVSDGAERTITRPLALACPAYVAPEALGITFAQPAPFTEANVPQNIGFTTTGGVAFVKALDVPEGWTVTVSPLSGNAGTFAITAPGTPDGDVNGEALVLAADASGKSVIRALNLLLIPTHAASTRTWTFGDQTWSDAIQMPDCDKTDFEGGTDTTPKADGRRYTTGDGHTWYYYSWAYVDANKSTICPSPWRVPATEDFAAIAANAPVADLTAAWGYGGFCTSSGSLSALDSYAYYWSSTEYTLSSAYLLNYDSSSFNQGLSTYKIYGFQVRCVK
ncbi:MAG: hypothetical protein LBN98_04635, partial [Prevotellaceae bacterium]|nr:hypothetical protein [Prevotellaceae bacterium]